ncbi:MAG: replication-relaxation family protein [Bryobacteraceae bacterium]
MLKTIFKARKRKAERPVLKEHEIKIVDACNRYFLLTPHQINRLLYKGGVQNRYSQLRALATDKYLQVVNLGRHNPYGRAPIAYALGSAGRTVLMKLGNDVPKRLRIYATKGETTDGKDEDIPMHRPHTLAVNDFLIAAELVSNPHISFFRFVHEKTLFSQRLPVVLPSGKATSIAPDAFIEFRISDSRGRHRACLIHEEDLGTEHRPAWTNKILAHLECMKGMYQDRFDVKRFAFTVHTTKGEDRLEELCQWTEKVLLDQNVGKAIRNSFYFSSFSAETASPNQLFIAPVWYRAFRERPLPILQVALDEVESDSDTDRVTVLPPRHISDKIRITLKFQEEQEAYADLLLPD